jgi:hypothetical protein
MQRSIFFSIIVSVFCVGAASAQQMGGYATPVTPPMVVAQPSAMQADLGGGFIEYLLGGQSPSQPSPPPQAYAPPGAPAGYIGVVPTAYPAQPGALLPDGMDPQYLRREVDFRGKEAPGSIVIDTPNKFLFLGWRAQDFSQEGMAGLGTARGNARASAEPAALHGRRPEQSARRARALSRLDALPHPRIERALDYRP